MALDDGPATYLLGHIIRVISVYTKATKSTKKTVLQFVNAIVGSVYLDRPFQICERNTKN